MKVAAISGLNSANRYITGKQNQLSTIQNNNSHVQYELSNLGANYIISFTSKKNNKADLPEKLEKKDIEDCNPMTSEDSDTEKLSGVLSTALKDIKPEIPVLLGCSDRGQSQKFIENTFKNVDLFDDEQLITDIIFVEDDRILDEPVLFIKDNNGDICLIGSVLVMNKETKERIPSSSLIKLPINPEIHSIQFSTSEMDYISLGEMPAKQDLRYVKKYDVDDIIGNDEFPETGKIISGEMTMTIPQNSKYKPSDYPMFKDIGGNKEAIERVIEDIYAPLCYPEIFGKNMNKGTILEGPSGTGKSMLGLALCNEMSKKMGKPVSLHEISGAEMQTSAVGGSESNWRALFKEAIDKQPSLILIDEVDACIPKRDSSSNARYDNQVVNQLLTLFSRLEKSDNLVYVIGMTNRADAIDPAMLRQGRFGNLITVGVPKGDDLREIYDKISVKYNFDDTVNPDEYLKRVESIKGTGSTIAGTLELASKYSRRRQGIYKMVLDDTVTKEAADSCLISMEDMLKALNDEQEKLKKAKINSDRTIIKGFST